MKRISFWVVFGGLSFAINWYYQPILELVITGTVLLIGLAILVAWSAAKLGSGLSAFAKTLLVAAVAGFMHSQAMDIAYSVLSAPAGGRFDLVIETAVLALFLTAGAALLKLLSSGPKQEK